MNALHIPTDTLKGVVQQQPYPLVFMTISGAHLYGFPSRDSDFDLRGVHVLPLAEAIGILPKRETIDEARDVDGLEVELVSHDATKFFTLLLRRNGYVLEQLYSPLVLHTTPEHDELKEIARGCITKRHMHHYAGFARRQWELFRKEPIPQIKPLLYVYRVLLTGIHLMRTGEIEANLIRLNEVARLRHVDELIRMKTEGREKEPLATSDVDFHEREYHRLTSAMESEHAKSQLPEQPTAREAMNDLLVRIRTGICFPLRGTTSNA